MSDLYDTDFHEWAETQAALLRSRSANALDWDNLAEEIESLAKSDGREVANRLLLICQHLLKWEYQPGRRTINWRSAIRARSARSQQAAQQQDFAGCCRERLRRELHRGREDAAEETGLLRTCLRPLALPRGTIRRTAWVCVMPAKLLKPRAHTGRLKRNQRDRFVSGRRASNWMMRDDAQHYTGGGVRDRHAEYQAVAPGRPRAARHAASRRTFAQPRQAHPRALSRARCPDPADRSCRPVSAAYDRWRRRAAVMTRIVTTHYRYKRPPRKRKAVALEVPAIVTAKSSRRPHVWGGKGGG